MKRLLKYAPYSIRKFFKHQYADLCLNEYLKFKKTEISLAKSDKLQNILYLNTLLGKGGAAKITYDMLAKNFQNKGFITKVLVNEVFGNIPGEDYELLPRSSQKEQKILNQVQDERTWLDFFHLSSFDIKNLEVFKKCDIFHLNNLHGNYFSLFALPELTALKPVIWTLHDEFAFTGHCAFTYDCNNWTNGCYSCPNLDEYPAITKDTCNLLYETKKKIYEASDFTVLCYSKWMKDRLEKSILKNKDIRFIYNGINEKIFKPYDKKQAREELGLPVNKTILMFCSNGASDNNKQKGGKYLSEVYETLKSREDLFFVTLGNAKRNYSSENYLNVEYIHDENLMAKYYSAADLFIFPTMAETFGLVVAEALACGLPVITFNTGPMQELVEHMKNGYVATSQNTSDFVTGIELFINNVELKNRASKNARDTVLEKFTIDKMTNAYLALYEEIYNSSKLK